MVYFSNTSILKTIEQENKKTKKIKELLVLIARMFFIASLVIAFAMPYMPNDNAINDNADNLVAIYIDNSMSMQSHSSEKTLFDDARMSALKLVENLNPTQKFILLSNDRDPKNEYPMNKDEVLMRLDEMKVEAEPVSFEDVYNNVSLIRKKNNFNTATLFAYSDYQKNMLKMDGIKNDTTIQIVAFPLKSDFQNNIYIDTAWLQSPVLQKGFANELNVRVVNNTNENIKGHPVTFSVEGNTMAVSSVDVEAGSSSDVSMQFVLDEIGDVKAQVSIKDSPITFDDDYYLVLKVRPSINVIEIKPSAVNGQQSTVNSLELLFDGDALINYQPMESYKIDRQSIMNSQMIVLHEEANVNATMQQTLVDFVEEGGSLVIFNNENTKLDFLYDKLGIVADNAIDDNVYKVENVATKNIFFDDIFVKFPDNADLPDVSRHISFRIKKSSEALTIMTLQNGDPLLMLCRIGKGHAFVYSTSLDEQYSGLAAHALFVPLTYKMAFLGGKTSDLSYTLGKDVTIDVEVNSMIDDDNIIVKSDNGLHEIFPVMENRNNRVYLSFYETLPSAGFYDVMKNDERLEIMAWNDDRKESKMDFYDKEKVMSMLKDKDLSLLATLDYDEIRSDNMTEAIVKDSMLWKIFIVIALISLLIEILILRFWK